MSILFEMDQDSNQEFNHQEYQYNQEPKKPRKRKAKARVLVYSLVFSVVGVWFFSSKSVTTDADSSFWYEKMLFTNQTEHLVENQDRVAQEKIKDRVNILFLGMGGRVHEGGYLTDTIILASLELSTKKIALISVPRDLSVPVPDKGWRKINAINAYAEAENAGSGGEDVTKVLSELLNIPIDYYLRVDFAGFEKIVEDLGGLKVYVENSFDDYQYPVTGREDAEDYESRFTHLHFDKGWNYMDGDLALKYARSRHGTNGEGSDFARGRRQQQVIEAIKNKAISVDILKPSVLTSIVEDLNYHISTDLGIWDGIRLWKEFKDLNTDDIINEVLDNSYDGLLVEMINSEGSYVLSPRSGDFAEIAYLVKNIFNENREEFKSAVSVESPSIDIRNGTFVGGLATNSANQLQKMGFNVVNIGNSSRRDFEKSIIYDLTYGEKMASLKVLKERTGASISFGLPSWIIEDLENELIGVTEDVKQPDFILIIGKN
ncbi:LCP family protein [Patescibacteria group bacterium]|nr:LCP family protein [Patescibacteria group bacterium]